MEINVDSYLTDIIYQIAELNQSSLNRMINLMIEKEPDLAERLEFSINVAFQEIQYQKNLESETV